MKKIMFNDRYDLTQAVIDGRKTMTRRVIKCPDKCNGKEAYAYVVYRNAQNRDIWEVSVVDANGYTIGYITPKYQIGEIVAVAQSYNALNKSGYVAPEWLEHTCESSAGYKNKMFVRADLMPHRIRITDIKIERLQDITEEEALLEGVYKYDKPPLHHERDLFAPWPPDIKPYKHDMDNLKYRATARYAFAALIDKVSGKGTWDSNPYVFVYEFELMRGGEQ